MGWPGRRTVSEGPTEGEVAGAAAVVMSRRVMALYKAVSGAIKLRRR